jgi:hypothetical protein
MSSLSRRLIFSGYFLTIKCYNTTKYSLPE